MFLEKKGLKYWFPQYLKDGLVGREKLPAGSPQHLFFCVVDHYEPFNGGADLDQAKKRVDHWRKEYPRFANRHLDCEGHPVQHCWFYPPHHDIAFLPPLVELCMEGYGDIEMHLHHNHMKPFPDTSDTLRAKLLKCIDDYSCYGIFMQPGGNSRYAFIHGDWSLDNSGSADLCGVNDELSLLMETGCYADFTFPSLNISQPEMVNRMFYAKDDPEKPKSYNRGVPVVAGGEQPDDTLMMIQGITGIRYDQRKKLKFSIETSDLDGSDPPTVERVDYWVKNGISIPGKPEWRFIKLHTHGAPEVRWSANLGDDADRALDYMAAKYNDGEKYVLHYVTAREMYNLIKCAEVGCDMNFQEARNYVISPYPYAV